MVILCFYLFIFTIFNGLLALRAMTYFHFELAGSQALVALSTFSNTTRQQSSNTEKRKKK